jgi:hypothetical protein
LQEHHYITRHLIKVSQPNAAAPVEILCRVPG